MIFFARILDVSLGTVRIILLSKGNKNLAPVIGFIEIFVWLIAFKQLFTNLDNWIYYFSYALGFSAGTYVGIIIEEKLSFGKVMLRIICKEDSKKLLKKLDKSKYTSTTVSATGPNGKVNIIQIILNRKNIGKVLKIIQEVSPKSFYSIEDVRYAREEIVLVAKNRKDFFSFFRKGK